MWKYVEKFLEDQKYIAVLYNTSSLVYEDLSTIAPKKGQSAKNESLQLLSKLVHEKEISKSYKENIANIVVDKQKPSIQRMVKIAKKDIEQAQKLSKEFVEEFSKTQNDSSVVRHEAKEKNDFKGFRPHLEKVVKLSRKKAEYLDPNKNPYDVLLDAYEEWMTSEKLDNYFSKLKQTLQKIQKTSGTKKKPYKHNNRAEVKQMIKEICSNLWFDFEAGRLWNVVHPFETTLALQDVVINVNLEKDLLEIIYSTIHECGHALYEQNIDPEYEYTNLQSWVTMGFHESQSRTIENIVGRSYEFCEYLYSIFQKYAIDYRKNPQEIYDTVNYVQPSLIRIEADEVTYNYHIIMRYEIEKELINWTIAVKDIPTIRNQKMQEYLWIQPTNDGEGCLQDVHRPEWLIGYFPTYILWNLYWITVYQAFLQVNPQRKNALKKWDFSSYFKRYKANIWKYWSLYTPEQVIEKISDEKDYGKVFAQYLEEKHLS